MGRLRVSCAAFCRIEYEGQYLFILNRERARRGQWSITPIGGALWHFDPPILREIGAQVENPGAHDLRFCLPDADGEAHLDAFRGWFYQRVERETDPFRELREELVEEQGILPALVREHVNLRFAYALERRSLSNRPGAPVAETQFFWEVFDAELTDHGLMRRLRDADRQQGIFWLSMAEATRARPIRWEQHDVQVDLGFLLHTNGAKG